MAARLVQRVGAGVVDVAGGERARVLAAAEGVELPAHHGGGEGLAGGRHLVLVTHTSPGVYTSLFAEASVPEFVAPDGIELPVHRTAHQAIPGSGHGGLGLPGLAPGIVDIHPRD